MSLFATLGLLDAEYDAFDIQVGGVITDVSDRKLVNSPEVSGSIGASYAVALSSRLTVTLHGDVAYRSDYANEVTASPNLNQDAYWLANAFVSVGSTDGRWEARVGIKNISDEAIRVQGFNLAAFPGMEAAFYAAPQTYNVRLIYRY